MSHRGRDVLRIESAVEVHAFGKPFDPAIGSRFKDSAPGFVRHAGDLARKPPEHRAMDANSYSNLFTVNGLRLKVNGQRGLAFVASMRPRFELCVYACNLRIGPDIQARSGVPGCSLDCFLE